LLCINVHIYLDKYQTCFVLYNVYLLVILLHVRLHYLTGNQCKVIKLEGRDVDFNMSEEEIESGIEEPLDPALENIARYR
jgi:hypothetical protein